MFEQKVKLVNMYWSTEWSG